MAPILLAFIFFIIDCGLLGYSYVSATNAVREGARCAAVGGTSAAVATRVSDTSGGLDASLVSIDSGPTTSYSPDPAEIGGSVTVSVDYTYHWISPAGLIPGLSNLTFNKSVTMRMETSDTTTKTSC